LPAHRRAVPAATALSPLAAGPKLSDKVAAFLRDEIVGGRYAPEARLPTEVQLAQGFSVSRTVVREAVSRLKSEGLLESRQGSGVFVHTHALVRPLRIDSSAGRSAENVLHIVELRRAIEAEAAAIAAERRTSADLARMRRALRDVDRAVARGEDGVEEDVRFHRAIAAATGNEYYLRVLEFLGQFLRGATRVTRANEARRADFARQVREEHAAVLDAIAAGDAAAARRAGARHMLNAARRIRQADPTFWADEGGSLVAALPPR
jgi:GntR family transcriptional regulator, transcriptional repressor for pyruvate dehydrogenase complex